MNSYSKPCRLDRNSQGEGIIQYVREDIPSKLINSSCNDHNKEYSFVELNLRKQKWPIICNYNLDKTMVKEYLEYISKEIDSLSSKYDNFLLLGDFNSQPTQKVSAKYTTLKTYFLTNTSCVDLIITNISPEASKTLATSRSGSATSTK